MGFRGSISKTSRKETESFYVFEKALKKHILKNILSLLYFPGQLYP